jgi:hypothetical protein
VATGSAKPLHCSGFVTRAFVIVGMMPLAESLNTEQDVRGVLKG